MIMMSLGSSFELIPFLLYVMASLRMWSTLLLAFHGHIDETHEHVALLVLSTLSMIFHRTLESPCG